MKFCPRDRTPNPDDAEVCVNPDCRAPLPGGRAGGLPTPEGRPDAPVLGSLVQPGPVLVRILEGGREDRPHSLGNQAVRIGRSHGELRFPDDPYLSERHASVRLRGEQLLLRDTNSRNGTFVRRAADVRVVDGLECLLGLTRLVWSRGEASAQRTLDQRRDAPQSGVCTCRVKVFPPGERPPWRRDLDGPATLGREGADLVLDDPYVSVPHAVLEWVNGEPYLRDHDSVNGISVRIPPGPSVELDDGAMFRAGSQVFLFTTRDR